MKTELELKNDLAEIERLAARVLSFGQEHKLPDELVWEIRLVLEEIITNIISYGYEDQAPHTIAVSIVNSDKDITLCVRDDARPFNLLEHPAPDLDIPLEERGIGGMGVHIVREIMDEIDYRREADENVVVMRRLKT
jgi:anti-sigma regulatory factor (Ser/Thr protein kinase)